jgi:hypothetical protein
MSKKILLLAFSAMLVLGSVAWFAHAATPSSDSVKIAALVTEMNGVTPAKLQAMGAIAPKPYTLPEPGVDVMRARLTESYTIAGIGQDTVEINGWIAVTHGQPSTKQWNTAVVETRFVALDLNGESKLFGPVHVTFDPAKPAVGAVGASVQLPEQAQAVLAALAAPPKTKQEKKGAPIVDGCGSGGTSTEGACFICRAPVSVTVAMSNLGLTMETKVPATWYSVVNTIPPVGHTASVTVEPVPLVTSDGREVGTLDSGRVLFRETVRHVALSNDVDVKATEAVAAKPASSARPAVALHK